MSPAEWLILLLILADILWGVLVGAYLILALPIAYLIDKHRDRKGRQ